MVRKRKMEHDRNCYFELFLKSSASNIPLKKTASSVERIYERHIYTAERTYFVFEFIAYSCERYSSGREMISEKSCWRLNFSGFHFAAAKAALRKHSSFFKT